MIQKLIKEVNSKVSSSSKSHAQTKKAMSKEENISSITNTLEIGRVTKKMGMGYLHSQMETDRKATSGMIRNTALAPNTASTITKCSKNT